MIKAICQHCGKPYNATANTTKYFYCMEPECRKAKRSHMMKNIYLYKRMRKCVNCGRVYLPDSNTVRGRIKDITYCPHPMCQQERIDDQHRKKIAAGKKFRAENPDYNKKYLNRIDRTTDRDIFRKKKCSCGNKIRVITEWPYSVEAPSRPYRCEECRSIGEDVAEGYESVEPMVGFDDTEMIGYDILGWDIMSLLSF